MKPYLLKFSLQVWTHLDNGSCAGQAIGVRTRMDNGLSGFIPTKMISDKHISSPHERVRVHYIITNSFFLKPLSPNGDQHQISPCYISTLATREVVRI